MEKSGCVLVDTDLFVNIYTIKRISPSTKCVIIINKYYLNE